MSRARSKPTRHLALVEQTRQPAPLSYDITPKNRQQRRTLAKLQKRRRAGPKP